MHGAPPTDRTAATAGEPRLTRVDRAGGPLATATVTLDYEGRLLRRRRLALDGGGHALVDLPEATSLNEGDVLAGEGAAVRVVAAPEPCLVVTGPGVARYAWHVGNRHAPCAIATDRLTIRDDPVMADMLRRLGATLEPATIPFAPEGGAYGHGRTMGHAHDQDHGLGRGHGHDHGHGQAQGSGDGRDHGHGPRAAPRDDAVG